VLNYLLDDCQHRQSNNKTNEPKKGKSSLLPFAIWKYVKKITRPKKEMKKRKLLITSERQSFFMENETFPKALHSSAMSFYMEQRCLWLYG